MKQFDKWGIGLSVVVFWFCTICECPNGTINIEWKIVTHEPRPAVGRVTLWGYFGFMRGSVVLWRGRPPKGCGKD